MEEFKQKKIDEKIKRDNIEEENFELFIYYGKTCTAKMQGIKK